MRRRALCTVLGSLLAAAAAVPALAADDISGMWEGNITNERGEHIITEAQLIQTGTTVSGTISMYGAPAIPICKGTFDGQVLSFEIDSHWKEGQSCDDLDAESAIRFEGRRKGPSLSGTADDGEIKGTLFWIEVEEAGPVATPETAATAVVVPPPTETAVAVPTEVPPTETAVAVPTEPPPTETAVIVPTELPPTETAVVVPTETAVVVPTETAVVVPTEPPPTETAVGMPTEMPTAAAAPPTKATAATGGAASPYEAARGYVAAVRGEDAEGFVALWNSKNRQTDSEMLRQIYTRARPKLKQIADAVEQKLTADAFRLQGSQAILSYDCTTRSGQAQNCVFTLMQEADGRWYIEDLD